MFIIWIYAYVELVVFVSRIKKIEQRWSSTGPDGFSSFSGFFISSDCDYFSMCVCVCFLVV